jgi:peroxiredoxin
MAQLRQDYQRFVDLETEVVVVGPEGPAAFKSYWQGHDLPFVGLPDPSHQVLKLFGQQIKLFKWGRMPAQVVVDKQGIARFVHYGDSMSDIPNNQELLELLAAIEPPNRGERDQRAQPEQQGGNDTQHAKS